MKSEKVAFKIRLAEELLKDIKGDFRTGLVMAAQRKTDTLQRVAEEIRAEIQAATVKVSCDFVTLQTESDCKNRAVWKDSAGSVKVCGHHKAELVRVAHRGEDKTFIRLDESTEGTKTL